MKTWILLRLPLESSYAKKRSLPTTVCNLVVAAQDEPEVANALGWYGSFLFEMFEPQVSVQPISLWAKTNVIIDQLASCGIKHSCDLISHQEFLAAQCHSAEDVRSALEIVWPNAEALVCYKTAGAQADMKLMRGVAASWKPYEDRYNAHLALYKIFAFMESGRLSVDVYAYEPQVMRAFELAFRTSTR